MNEATLVWWIIVPLFVAVGLYLIWYSRRRKKMFEAFASSHKLRIRQEHKTELQKTLDRCFSFKNENMARSFDQLSSPIDGGSIWLFRAVELLDLNPYAQTYSTHFPRIAALFKAPTDHNEFFILDKSMQVKQKLPRSNQPGPKVAEITKRVAASCNARHSLSLTLSNGYGLVYFEPLVTGGETIEDMNSLYCIAKNMNAGLSGGV